MWTRCSLSGLVPGNKEFETLVSLTDNKRMVGGRIVGTGYFNKWCYIKPNENTKSAYLLEQCLKNLSKTLLFLVTEK